MDGQNSSFRLTNQPLSEYENASAEELIQWVLNTFGQRSAVCTSFQAEGMVILDLAWRMDPHVRVFTIDTGRLPQETHELIDSVQERYQIPIEVICPDQSELSQLVTRHGMNLFYQSVPLRLLCCEARKVNPLNRVLQDLETRLKSPAVTGWRGG